VVSSPVSLIYEFGEERRPRRIARSLVLGSYSISTPLVCTVSGNTVTLVAVGNCGLKATQSGNRDNAAAPVVCQNFAVTTAAEN